MNNIQKQFKAKSALRKMADGGQVAGRQQLLGDGMARRAGNLMSNRANQIDAAVDAAVNGTPPPQQTPPAQQTPPPEKRGGLRGMLGFADGGQVQGQTKIPGNGMAQRAGGALMNRRAQIDAAVDAAVNGGTPPPPPPPEQQEQKPRGGLRGLLGLADGGTASQQIARDYEQLVGQAPTATNLFTPQEMEQFAAAGQASAANAAAMRDMGVQAGNDALAMASRPPPAMPVESEDMAPPEIELADGGKVQGKGGPTDDAVGPVALSDGEYVLPADTVKIVGREKLDALRLATHDFVDEGNKPKSQLRRMADGGAFYVDPKGVATRAKPPGTGVVPYTPPTITPSTISSAAPRPSPVRAIMNGAGAVAKGVAQSALPIAVMGGVKQSFDDLSSGRRDEFNKSIGATGPISSVAGDALRVLGNVGNAVTGGAAGYAGQKLAGYIGSGPSEPKSPTAGASQPAPAGASQSPFKTTGTPALAENAYQRSWLAQNGVPLDQQGSQPVTEESRLRLIQQGGGTPGQYVNLGNYGGDANIYGTASKPGGVVDTFMGVGPDPRPNKGVVEDPVLAEIRNALRGNTGGEDAPRQQGPVSNAYEINQRFDNLAQRMSGMYSRAGQGNLARRLTELETARANALNVDNHSVNTARGQDMAARTAADNNAAQMRQQALASLASMANSRDTTLAKAAADAQKMLEEGRKVSEERMEANVKEIDTVAKTFAAGDKDLEAKYSEVLGTLPDEQNMVAARLAPEAKRAFYTNILRQQIGRTEGLVAGRSPEALVQNVGAGTLLGAASAYKSGAGKTVDTALGMIPRVGPTLSKLRPVENLMRLGPLLGAAGGYAATPEVPEFNRYDPIATDPETGLEIPARRDWREARTYGLRRTFSPFNDDVQTVGKYRTNKPTPDEVEAARRHRAALGGN